jgi:hypothetical protein
MRRVMLKGVAAARYRPMLSPSGLDAQCLLQTGCDGYISFSSFTFLSSLYLEASGTMRTSLGDERHCREEEEMRCWGGPVSFQRAAAPSRLTGRVCPKCMLGAKHRPETLKRRASETAEDRADGHAHSIAGDYSTEQRDIS